MHLFCSIELTKTWSLPDGTSEEGLKITGQLQGGMPGLQGIPAERLVSCWCGHGPAFAFRRQPAAQNKEQQEAGFCLLFARPAVTVCVCVCVCVCV